MSARAFALLLAAAAPAFAAGVEPPPGLEPPAFEQAAVDFRAGRYAECQAGFANVASATGRAGLSARAAYGSACCAAQRGALNDAFGALGLAIANGFDDVERALTDERLAPLAADKRWLPLLQRIEEVRSFHVKSYEPKLYGFWLELEDERAGRAQRADEAEVAKRIEATLDIVDHAGLRQPHDYLHAAAVLLESSRGTEVGRAVSLTRRALELDPDLLELRPLHAQAVDRQLLLQGKPQKFGTQSVRDGEKFRLYRVDPEVTDSERKLWGVPPLAELEARLAGASPKASAPEN